MAVYYINLLLILGLAWPLCISKQTKRRTVLFLLATFGYMWAIATFRYGIGYDYFSYEAIFQTVANPSLELFPIENLELGFIVLTKVMGLFISNTVVMYGVYGFLIYVPVAWFIYKYSQSVWLSTWLYATLSFFYGSMNFIRQNLACSILLLGYGLLKKNKGVKIPLPHKNSYLLSSYILVVLLASTFHKTALIMIPIVLVCNLELNKYIAIIYGVGTFLLFMSSNIILDVITNYIFSSYRGSVFLEVGFPVIFLFLPFIIFGSCLSLYSIWKKRDEDAIRLMNFMLYNAIIWIFITKHFILERFSLTIYIFVLLSIPAALECLKCTQEEYAILNKFQTLAKKSNKEKAEYKRLYQNIKDHEKYYWSAVVAILFVTFIYNEFGSGLNNFHGVFPYQSIF